MDWAQILVTILAIFLAIFLLLGIILVALLVKVTIQIKAMTVSARSIGDHVERIVAGLSKVTSPVFLVKMILKHIKSAKRRKKRGDDV
jgi:uncharacterized protein involved in cysteine biosynthesis